MIFQAGAVIDAVAVASVAVIGWRSKHPATQNLACLLFVSWAVSNLAVGALTFENAPYVFTLMDTLCAIYVARMIFKARQAVSIGVFVVFAVMSALHLVSFALGLQGKHDYYHNLNQLFRIQLALVGASGGYQIYRRWFRAPVLRAGGPAGVRGGGS